MIHYDFVVTNMQKIDGDKVIKHKLITEKVAVLDDDRTLYDVLKNKFELDDHSIASVIEQLEGLPYGAKHVYTVGNDGRILIEQV